MVLRMLLPVLLASLLFFVLLLELVDLFPNISTYIDREVPLGRVLTVAVLYAPRCLTWAVPVSLVFSVSYTLGTLYRNNELIAIFGSGISLRRLILPLLAVGALFAAGMFWFQENVVIDALARKNTLHQEAVRRSVTLSNANVTVISDDGDAVYQADFYDDARATLRELVVLLHRPRTAPEEGSPAVFRRYDARSATWSEGAWTLRDAIVYVWREDGSFQWSRAPQLRADFLPEGPATFQKPTRKVEEMRIQEAREWVRRLERAGLDYLEAQTEYYARYFFALTPFIVTILACSVGGRIRKNVLLMNLLLSLVLSVVYYVAHMVAVILAKNAVIPPMVGAGAATLILLVGGFLAVRAART